MKQLNAFQRYLLDEFVEEWREGHMSRREMVKRAVYLTGGTASAATVLLSLGCGPSGTPTTAPPTRPTAAGPTSAPTTAPAATTRSAAAVAPTAAPAASPLAAPVKPAPPATSTAPRSPLSVKEDDPAVQAEWVDFPGDAGKVLGYLARPKAVGTYAPVIVIHENRGLTPHIQDVARRAAKEGLVALAVDLLSRNGGTQAVADDARAAGLLAQARPEDLVADLAAGVKYVRAVDVARKDKTGAFGFCFGGGYTYRLAVMSKEISAAVPFYGAPIPPIEQFANTSAAIFGIYAENDQRVVSTMPQVEEALKRAGKTYQMKVYPGVGHAFHNDTGAAWNEQQAVQAWKDCMDWLKKHLA